MVFCAEIAQKKGRIWPEKRYINIRVGVHPIMLIMKTKAVAFCIITEQQDTASVFQQIVELDFEVIEEKSFDKEEMTAEMTLTDGSEFTIDPGENVEGDLHIHFTPGDNEDNFNMTDDLFERLSEILEETDAVHHSLTVGGIFDKPVEPIISDVVEAQSSFNVEAIQLKDGNHRYGISPTEDGDVTRVTVTKDVHSFDLNEEKASLLATVEEFVGDSE